MNNIGPTFIAVVSGIIGLAIIAVLVAQKAQTSTVVQGVGTALSSIIGAAVSPVTGGGGNQFGSAGSAFPGGGTTGGVP
jgi:hypothetical protein